MMLLFQLVVHVGVDYRIKPKNLMKIEQEARNYGYRHKDEVGLLPAGGRCVQGAPGVIKTRLDVDKVTECVNTSAPGGIAAYVSQDANQ